MKINVLYILQAIIISTVSSGTFAQTLPNVLPSTPQPSTFQVQRVGISPSGQPQRNYRLPTNTNPNYQRQISQYEKDRLEVQRMEELKRSINRDLNKIRTIQYALPGRGINPKGAFYHQAFDNLQKMNPDEFSIKDATFIIENAFYDNQKSYQEYEEVISNTTQFIAEAMIEQKLDFNDNVDKNQTIFAFITDTLSAGGRTHYPYRYDFNDYMGQKNWDNMFVHKLMFTGSGQCNSMPRYFLILAEQMNAKSHLALAPKHSFIRFQDNAGEWHNAELTSGAIMTDHFMVESGYMKSEAISNGSYMTSQSKRQLMSQLLNDLASGYISKFGYDGFVKEVIDKSLELNPEGMNGNLHKMIYQIVEFKFVARQLGVRSKQELLHYPKLTEMDKGLQRQDAKLRSMGYETMPQERYEAWLSELEDAKKKQEKEDLKELKFNKSETLKN